MDKRGKCPVCGKESVLVAVLVSKGSRGKVAHMCGGCLRDVKKGLKKEQDVCSLFFCGIND